MCSLINTAFYEIHPIPIQNDVNYNITTHKINEKATWEVSMTKNVRTKLFRTLINSCVIVVVETFIMNVVLTSHYNTKKSFS